jgi:hypothetical protein
MTVELKKVNEPSGKYWYGIWVDGECQIPSYGMDLEKAQEAYIEIIENLKEPKPRYETIKTDTI